VTTSEVFCSTESSERSVQRLLALDGLLARPLS
jgi:hypothetical protein